MAKRKKKKKSRANFYTNRQVEVTSRRPTPIDTISPHRNHQERRMLGRSESNTRRRSSRQCEKVEDVKEAEDQEEQEVEEKAITPAHHAAPAGSRS